MSDSESAKRIRADVDQVTGIHDFMSTRANVICNCCIRSYKSLSSINLMRARANDASPEQDEGRTDRKKIRRRLSLLVSLE